jgi:hypothetical protein
MTDNPEFTIQSPPCIHRPPSLYSAKLWDCPDRSVYHYVIPYFPHYSTCHHNHAAVAERPAVHDSWPPRMATSSAYPGCLPPLRDQEEAARSRDVPISKPDAKGCLSQSVCSGSKRLYARGGVVRPWYVHCAMLNVRVSGHHESAHSCRPRGRAIRV